MLAMYIKFGFLCIVVEEQEAMLQQEKTTGMALVLGRKIPKCKNCGPFFRTRHSRG